MVVPAAGAVDMPFLALEVGFELRRVALRSVTSAFEKRKSTTLSSYSGARSWAANIGSCWTYLRKRLAVLALILRGRLGDQPLHLLIANLDAVGGADFRQQEPEADAALGDAAIFGGVLLDLGKRRIGIRFVARFVPQLTEDVLVLGLDHRLGNRKVVALGKLVEQLALHVRAGEVR